MYKVKLSREGYRLSCSNIHLAHLICEHIPKMLRFRRLPLAIGQYANGIRTGTATRAVIRREHSTQHVSSLDYLSVHNYYSHYLQ